MSEIFISYSREDKVFANKIHSDLIRSGSEVWMDSNIEAGMLWDKSIHQAIRKCKYFILIVSLNSSNSENVLDELNLARDEGKEILPVIKEECDIPYRLRRFNYLDFSENYEVGFSFLLKRLQFPLKKTECFYLDANNKINFISEKIIQEIITNKKRIFCLMIFLAILFSFSSIFFDLKHYHILLFIFSWSAITYVAIELIDKEGFVESSKIKRRYDILFIPSKIKILS